jgi:hypothetical protein
MKQLVFTNMDDNTTIFFSEELEHVKSRSYDVKYPELLARRLFPLSSEVPSGAESLAYETYDHVGVAKIIHNYSQDLPTVEVKGKKTVRLIYSTALSFGYSLQDVRNAKMAGKSLNQRKSNACRRQMLVLENKLAFHGDATTDIPGFVNSANINAVTMADSAGSTSTLWSTKTPTEILADVSSLTTSVFDGSNGVETVDTMLLPLAQYTQINDTPRSTTSDTTIMEYILKTNAFIKEIIPVYELKGAAPSSAAYDSTDCVIVYKRDPEKLTLEVPQDVEYLNPQEKALYYQVPVHARTAGVVIYYPKSIAQGNGI